ncbi:VanZ family protein [bacterium]|nr:MAG: VanZ family protein [bacterium]
MPRTMTNPNSKLRAIPAVVVMVAIFLMSSTYITQHGLATGVSTASGGSVSKSGFMDWWKVNWWIFVKGFHAGEFAVLALLWRRALPSLPAWAITVLFAASDEWHQTFVGPRGGRWTDFMIDATGATAAILAAQAKGHARVPAWIAAAFAMLAAAYLFR